MAKTKKRKPVKRAKPNDELVSALRDMVTSAEASGGRDNPEVARARAVLDKQK